MGLYDDPAALDHRLAFERSRELLERLVSSLDRDTFVDDALDHIVALMGADRGLIVLGDLRKGGQVINARGRRQALSASEREEVSKTVMAEAQRTDQCIEWGPEQGRPVESMRDLGIVRALAAPLRTASWWLGSKGQQTSRGVIYVDYRDPRKEIGALHRQFLELATVVLAAVVEQREQIALVREDLRKTQAQQVSAPQGPGLEELLRPKSMAALRREVTTCLAGSSSILILGESGTGKTRVAEAVAQASGRTPVVRAVLGSSDDLNTITSELFGHERGAYSGATAKRVGTVEYAHEGTLILDEILNLPAHAQQLLLDFTQFGTYRPLGWDKREPKHADVRIVAATNGDLAKAIREGRFREDLYYRLAGTVLIMPPLRDRREDIPGMVASYLSRRAPERAWRLDVAARRWLVAKHHAWPGNVRQLEAVAQRALERALAEDPEAHTIREQHLSPPALGTTTNGKGSHGAASSLPVASRGTPADGRTDLPSQWSSLQAQRSDLDAQERALIQQAMDQHRGIVAHVARELGVARTSLISRMDTLDIARPRRRKTG